MIITVQEFHLTGQAVSWLLISNLAFVIIGIYATIIYLNNFSVKYRRKFSVNKLIIASVIATWTLSLTLIPCGTGISIIGVSLNLFTGLASFKDGLQLKAQGHMQHGPKVWAYVIADTLLLVIVASYLISGPIQHLLGLCLFALILFLIEPSFRDIVKGLFAERSAKVSQ
jgi:membrane-associated HD superfamily phosphohydrolase